ncbi:hypothetical protein SDC9_149318 [bioreactor metagenome]|uniref:Uncharacterized protein n=1 Tax=bioreactor metagenome TaxID=1076179 RepID=A0A645EJ98_9ZZZZ
MHDRNHRASRRFEPARNQLEHLLLVDQVEVVGGFVQNQHARVLREYLRQKRSLQFAAGESEHRLLGKRAHSRKFQRTADSFVVLVPAAAERARRIGVPSQTDDRFNGKRVTHRMRLGQNAQTLCKFARTVTFNVLFETAHLARVGRALRNGVDNGALARAVGADQHQPVAFLQRKAHVIHNGQRAVAHG